MNQEKLKQRLIELLDEAFFEQYDKRGLLTAPHTAEALIANGVTIRERGEWIDKPTGAYRRMQTWCSNCGKHSGIGGIESNRQKPFCPNCGADMRGLKDE